MRVGCIGSGVTNRRGARPPSPEVRLLQGLQLKVQVRLVQGQQTFPVKGPGRKYFWLCGPDDLYSSYSTLLLQRESSRREQCKQMGLAVIQ